jgi:hypothetical protein
MSSLLQFKYLLFAMSAIVRPKHQALLAQELGFNAFCKVLRTSPRRPEVRLVKVMCETKQAALMSFVDLGTLSTLGDLRKKVLQSPVLFYVFATYL